MKRYKRTGKSKRKTTAEISGVHFASHFSCFSIQMIFFRPFYPKTEFSVSPSEKFSFDSMWQPPEIIRKHLAELDDDPILMDTGFTDLNNAEAKCSDVIMNEVSNEQFDFDEKMGDPNTANSLSDFQFSQPLFGSQSNDDEVIPATQIDLFEFEKSTEVFESPRKSSDAQALNIDVDMVSQRVANDDAQPSPTNEVNAQPIALDKVDGNKPIECVSTKRMKRLSASPLTPHMLEATKEVGDEGYGTEFYQQKTTDEMIDLCAEQSARVDKLMGELFAMR